MASGPERERGDKWAAIGIAKRQWYQKLPASTLSGVPDWLVGRWGEGLLFIEAKTYSAIKHSKKGTPRSSCTRAQQFFLDQVIKHGGQSRLLIVGEDRWIEHEWATIDTLVDWWPEDQLTSYAII